MSTHPDQLVPSCCKTPIVVRFGDCVLCMKDDCLGGWLWRQAKKHPTGGIQIRRIRRCTDEIWLDFIQFWRFYAWKKAAENGGSVGHLDVVNATTRYLHALRLREDPTETMTKYGSAVDEDEMPRGQVSSRCVKGMSMEALLELETEGLVESPHPYQRTLANEMVVMAGPVSAGGVLALAIAEQIEAQDAAVLLRQPIAVTVARIAATRERLRLAA